MNTTHTTITHLLQNNTRLQSLLSRNLTYLCSRKQVQLWIIAFHLYRNGLSQSIIDHISTLFNSCLLNTPLLFQSNKHLHSILQTYPNYIFIPIDHNARQCAIICPVRLHHLTKSTFIDDTKHFKIILNSSTSTITNQIRKLLQPHWFPHTIKKKPKFPKLYLILKLDGRARPIGSTVESLLNSRGLHGILQTAPIKHFILFNSTHLKRKIHEFNQLARRHNLIIRNKNYDIKNFYTEVNSPSLISKTIFITNRYCKFYKTNHISIPRSDKKLPTITGWSNDPRYYCLSIKDIVNVLTLAIQNAYFTLGDHILQQSQGLPMG